MSLTAEDLSQVRDVVVDAITTAIQELILPRFDEHDKRLAAIERDIRELKTEMRDARIGLGRIGGRLDSLEGRVESLEADIKELSAVVAAQGPSYTDKTFAKLSAEQKVPRIHENVKLLAREMGVTLPD
jgi:chromosome segregation ATPase